MFRTGIGSVEKLSAGPGREPQHWTLLGAPAEEAGLSLVGPRQKYVRFQRKREPARENGREWRELKAAGPEANSPSGGPPRLQTYLRR